MSDRASSSNDEALSAFVRDRLTRRYGRDRAAALYGYWQLLASPAGPTRLRATLGAAGYRAALAALAHAGVDVPRQTDPGPATGTRTHPGVGTPSSHTVERQLLRQARLQGVFGWGETDGRVDLSHVRAGAPGYSHETIVIGVQAIRLLPTTYHSIEVRARPARLDTAPPVLLRLGAYTDGSGELRVFAGVPVSSDGPEATTIFGSQGETIEVVMYRCYDGPTADDTSFVVARGLLT